MTCIYRTMGRNQTKGLGNNLATLKKTANRPQKGLSTKKKKKTPHTFSYLHLVFSIYITCTDHIDLWCTQCTASHTPLKCLF